MLKGVTGHVFTHMCMQSKNISKCMCSFEWFVFERLDNLQQVHHEPHTIRNKGRDLELMADPRPKPTLILFTIVDMSCTD